jgi:hypothetical protein
MSFELILSSIHTIKALQRDDNTSEVLGNPDASRWCERDGIVPYESFVSIEVGRIRTGRFELRPEGWFASVLCVIRGTAKSNRLAVQALGLTIVRFQLGHVFS